jgi:hypothetical protein
LPQERCVQRFYPYFMRLDFISIAESPLEKCAKLPYSVRKLIQIRVF